MVKEEDISVKTDNELLMNMGIDERYASFVSISPLIKALLTVNRAWKAQDAREEYLDERRKEFRQKIMRELYAEQEVLKILLRTEENKGGDSGEKSEDTVKRVGALGKDFFSAKLVKTIEQFGEMTEEEAGFTEEDEISFEEYKFALDSLLKKFM